MAESKDDEPKKGHKADPTQPPQKRVVVTYGMKPKPINNDEDEVPAEILPHTPTEVVKSPVETSIPPVIEKIEHSRTTLKGHIRPSEVGTPPPRRPVAPPPSSGAGPTPIPPQAPPPPGHPTQAKASTPPPRASGSGSSGLALFLSIMTSVAVVALMFYAYFSQQQLADLQEQTHHDAAAVSTLLAQAKHSVGQFETIQAENLREREALSTLRQDLERSQARFVMLRGNRDWVLGEVNYLVFMANERLKAANDIATAVAQLKVADDRLTKLADPSLLPLKTALTNDLAKLMNATIIDKQELWEQVGALSSLIATLRFKILGVNQKPEEPATTITMTSWKGALHESWKELKSLIKVTRIEDNPIPVAFDQQEQAQILRTLQLLNEQTQWAVLQGDSKVYIDTLQTLEKYVKSYFVEDEEQTALIRRIQQLEQQRVEIPVPDIADTLQALSRITIKKE